MSSNLPPAPPVDLSALFAAALTKAATTTASHSAKGAEVLWETSIIAPPYTGNAYHYTNVEGLEGIIKQSSLWATDVTYMNDSSEYIYSDQLISDGLRRLEKEFSILEALTPSLQAKPLFTVYAACFCRKKDLLSQWRAYSKSGTGYAIEFSWSELCKKIVTTGTVGLCGQIEYDPAEQAKIIDHIFARTIKEFATDSLLQELGRALTSGATPADLIPLVEKIAGLLAATGGVGVTCLWAAKAFLKSPAFIEEQELRIMTTRSDIDRADEEFAPSNGLLVPHVPLGLGEPNTCPIRRVIIGPSPHPTQARTSVERFLKKCGYNNVEVESSPIPLKV